jgi:hypothetical protein
MAVTIGGRAVAYFPISGTINAVNQSTWLTLATNVMSAIGGPIAGITMGANFGIFVDLACDSGSPTVVRVVFDDVQVTDGTTVATATVNLLAATSAAGVLAALASLASGGVTTPTVQFEAWGDAYSPGP